MNVLLLSPRGRDRNQQNDVLFDVYRDLEEDLALMMDDVEFIPNLALLTLAAYMPKNWNLCFIEEDYVTPDQSRQVLENHPWDLALISTVNYNASRGYAAADILRSRGVHTVIGGLHATALPDEARQHCDTLIVGEGEEAFVRFLQDFTAGEPKGYYRAETPVDLAQVRPPRYDLIPDPSRYNKMPLFATRGCPHNCEFCIFPVAYHHRYRHKTLEQVVAEIRAIKAVWPRPYLHFCDENLLADGEFSRRLVQAITREEVDWECFCDVAVADDDKLLDLLAGSRCRGLLIGLETVDPLVMKSVDPWKAKMLEGYPRRIRRIQKKGIPVTGLFMFGFDGDGPEVFSRTLDFIVRAGLYDFDFAVLTPIPGTPLYHRLSRQGRIFSRDWSRYTWTRVNFQPMHLSARQLEEGLLWLFKEFASGAMLRRRESNPGSARKSHREGAKTLTDN